MGSTVSSEGCAAAAAPDGAPEMWLNDATQSPTAAWLAGSAPSQEARWPRPPVEPRLSTLLSTPAPAEGNPTKAAGGVQPPAGPSQRRAQDLVQRLAEESLREPAPSASSGGDTVAVGSSADAGRGWPTAGRVGHTARSSPGNRVFCVASGGSTMTLYHAGEEAPAPVAVCGFCGALPREPEQGDPPSACRHCARWQDRRAAEITCVHSVEEENGAAALYCCARSGAISKRGLRGGVVCGAVQGHPGWTSCVLVLGRCLLTGSDDGLVREWDLSTGKQTRTMEAAAGLPVCLLAPKGGAAGTLFCGYNDGAVLVWSLADGRLLVQAGGRWPGGHSRSVRCLCDGGEAGVFSGSNDSTAGKWDASTGAALWHPRQQLSGWASCMLAWQPAQCLLVGCEDGSIQSRGMLSGEELRLRFEPAGRRAHGAAVTSLLALEAQGWLLSGAADGVIRKWHLGTGDLLQSLEGHGGAVMCMLACPAEDSLLSGSSDAALRRWSLRTGELLHTAKVPEGKVTGYVVRAAPEPVTFKVSDIRGKIQQEVREKICARGGLEPGPAAATAGQEPVPTEEQAAASRPVPQLPLGGRAGPETPPGGLISPAGHPLELTVVGPPQRAGMSPGSCDVCGRDVVEGEPVQECKLSNYWMCIACASKKGNTSPRTPGGSKPDPSISAKFEEPKNPNFPFRGWMRHQFKVSDLRGKVQHDVREKIAACNGDSRRNSRSFSRRSSGEDLDNSPSEPAAGPELASPRPEATGAAGQATGAAGQEALPSPRSPVGDLVEEIVGELVVDGTDEHRLPTSSSAGGGRPAAAADLWLWPPSSGGASGSAGPPAGAASAPPAGPPPPPAAPRSQSWTVCNDWLRSRAPGLGYRCSPVMEDKHPDKLMARWGMVIYGVDMGNNFVRTTTGTIGYLPKVFNGHQVLVLAGGPVAAEA